MNIREQLNAASRPYVLALAGWLALCAVALAIAELTLEISERQVPFVAVVIGCLGLAVLYWRLARVVRCPQCSQSLINVASRGFLLRIPQRAATCPHCGLDLNGAVG